MKKTVLILANYFPPTAGMASKRSWCFAKYLSALGYRVYVICPDTRYQYVMDETVIMNIANDVIVYSLKSIFSRIIGFLFVNKREEGFLKTIFLCCGEILYFLKARRFLSNFIKNNHIDIVWSTAPPHYRFSSCGLGYFVKRKFHIPWICDYRDLVYQFDNLRWTMKLREAVSVRFERKAFAKTDAIVVVSDNHRLALIQQYGLNNVYVINNGFDPDDFQNVSLLSQFDKFKIIYAGNYYPPAVSFRILLDAIHNLSEKNLVQFEDFIIEFYGSNVNNVNRVIFDHPLKNLVAIYAGITSNECVSKESNATVLLHMAYDEDKHNGIMTGKVFDYLAAGRPVLLISGRRNNCIAELVKSTNCGVTCITVDDIEKIILLWYEEWKKTGYVVCNTDMVEVNKYSRFEQTKQLSTLIDSLIS